MAKRIIHELIDDIDGKSADETVTFSVDGVVYEIDLSETNARKLREAFAPFIDAGTQLREGKAGNGRLRPSGGGHASADTGRGNRALNRTIREWAIAKGLEVSPRGRLAQDVIDQYRAAGRGR